MLKTTAMITERGLGDVISPQALSSDASFDAWLSAHPNPRFCAGMDESTEAEAMAAYAKWLHEQRVASATSSSLL